MENNNITLPSGKIIKVKGMDIPCLSTEHNPPMHIVLDAGEYEYVCPSCGKITKFTVPLITC